MRVADRFTVERIDPLRLIGPEEFSQCELMSPYVWRDTGDLFGVLVRAVPDGGEGASTGSIWFGRGTDGLSFDMDDGPVLSPGPGPLDLCGCEDPTVVRHGDELIVFYTGLDADGDGHLLWASGADVRSLRKHGVAATSFEGERDIKEAEIAVRDDHWTMGYEYARGEASMIGYAEGEGPTGPWRETRHGFGARDDHFDSWHLSPGPMLLGDSDRPIMFYNGATRDAKWGIGWVVFDHADNRILDRCEVPLIGPPGEGGGRNIAFAASLIDEGDTFHLYFSYNDRTCHRAVITRHGRDEP